MDKQFALVLTGVVLLLVGVFIISGGKQETSNVTFEGDPGVIAAGEKTKGNPEASVELIEYADFACPGCGALYPVMQQIITEFGEDINFAFRHFPLERLHPNAVAAHRAAEAAANQGKFWEMHDLMFERQQLWAASTSGLSVSEAIETFKSYAQELNLDMDQYNADVESQEAFNQIDLDIQSGRQLDVSGTPALILNGVKIDNPRSYEELRTIVQQAINDANPDSAEQESADTSSDES